MKYNNKIEKSRGDIFKDIGVAHPKRAMFRAQVMARITEIIKDCGMTQKEASKLLGLPQSKISCLMNGKLSMFSLGHLFEILNALDSDVEIIIKPKTDEGKNASTHVLLVTTA